MYQDSTERFFINLTNHPSDKWGAKQLEAASVYGKIIDMPFPEIKASDSEQEINTIVNKHIEYIEQNFDKNNTTIHIMGEFTFSFAIIKLLKEKGYKCVASTTERIVTGNEDGTKSVTFSFEQFREYL